VLELRTGGLRAWPQADGTVRLEVSGFDGRSEPGSPAVPSRLAWVEGVAGRKARIASVRASDVVAFDLRPANASAPTLVVARDGTVSAAERPFVLGAPRRPAS
jgi:hypothetical protein